MIGLASALLFVGYTLVYAAVANGGKFAAAPWQALREDAYTGAAPGAAGSPSPSAGGTRGSGGKGGIVSVLNGISSYIGGGGWLP